MKTRTKELFLMDVDLLLCEDSPRRVRRLLLKLKKETANASEKYKSDLAGNKGNVHTWNKEQRKKHKKILRVDWAEWEAEIEDLERDAEIADRLFRTFAALTNECRSACGTHHADNSGYCFSCGIPLNADWIALSTEDYSAAEKEVNDAWGTRFNGHFYLY